MQPSPALLFFLLCACASASPQRAPAAPPEEHAAIVATVDGMFTAMRERDAETLRSLVAEGAIIVRLGKDDTGAVRHAVIPAEAFIEGTAGGKEVIDERFTSEPVVQYDGEMATLWGEYEVRVDGRFVHCGVDAVQLAKLDGRWQVTAITYTGRKEGCASSGE